MTEFVAYEIARDNLRHNPAWRWHRPGLPRADGAMLASARYGEKFFAPCLPRAKFRMSQNDKFFMIGSCFARGLEAALSTLKFDVLSLTSEFNALTVANTGSALGATNKYNLHTILNELEWAAGVKDFPDEALVEIGEGLVIDPHMTPVFAPALRPEVAERRRIMTRVVHRAFEADVIVVTLGLVEIWKDQLTGLVMNTAPELRMVRANPGRFVFGRLGYQDNMELLGQVREVIRGHGAAGARMIVTVSPVPLEATFTNRDVVEATTYSKSMLRVVAEDFVSNHDDVEYFPSYEIVMNSPRLSTWMDDCRHVRGEVANYIMKQFAQHFLPDALAGSEELVTSSYVG